MAIIKSKVNGATLNGTTGPDIITGLGNNQTLNGKEGDDVLTATGSYSVLLGGAGKDLLTGLGSNQSFDGGAGNDIIFALGPNALVYGGEGDDAIAGNGTLYGNAGVDTICGLICDDKIVGEQESLRFIQSAIAGNVTDTIPVFSSDKLSGDYGDDSLYGDVVSVTFKGEAGANSGDITQTGVILTFAGDTLNGDMGNDVLVGDASDIILTARGGGTLSNPVTTLNSSGFVTNNRITTGSDVLWGGDGQDYLYGDISLLNLFAYNGTVNGSADVAMARVFGNQFNLAGDELHGGTKNDYLYGDIGTLKLFGDGGNALSSFSFLIGFNGGSNTRDNPNVFTMGWDQLYGDDGNDQLVGDIGNLTIQAQGGQVTEGDLAVPIVFGVFNLGSDTLDGGNGDDTLSGDIANLSFIGQGGTISSNSFLSEATTYTGVKLTAGDDTIIGGNGKDILHGDLGTFNLNYTGGTNSSEDITLAFAAGWSVDDFLKMGVDTLIGGSGDDVLYGDVGSITIVGKAGTYSGPLAEPDPAAAGALISHVSFTMNNDTLEGGSGNDRLYGDTGSFSLTLLPGDSVGEGCYVSDVEFRFGSDLLIGGLGNDTLVGDLADPTSLNVFLNAELDPVVPRINGLSFGNDTFQFSLGGANGHDVVKDMNLAAVGTVTCIVTNQMDTLKFTDVMNVNGGALDYTDVDAQSVFSNSGGHVKMSFAGGSVLFENINWALQDSVLDITPNVVVI